MSSADERVRTKAADAGLRAPAIETESISVLFDLDDPEQAEKLNRHVIAFGADYAETASLSARRVIMTIYPGGAKGLRR